MAPGASDNNGEQLSNKPLKPGKCVNAPAVKAVIIYITPIILHNTLKALFTVSTVSSLQHIAHIMKGLSEVTHISAIK